MLQLTTVSPEGNVCCFLYHIKSPTKKRSQQPAILLLLFYNRSEEDGRANFKQFFDVGV